MKLRVRLSSAGRLVLMAVVLSCLLAALGFGVVNALPTANRADRVGMRLLASLAQVHRIGTDLHLGRGRIVRATCTRTYGRETVTAGKMRIVLAGSRIDTRLRGARRASQQLVSAVSDLALCPGLLATDLASRIQEGPLQDLVNTHWHGVPAERFRLSQARPALYLYFTPRQLRPIGAVFVGRRIHGWSITRSMRPRS